MRSSGILRIICILASGKKLTTRTSSLVSSGVTGIGMLGNAVTWPVWAMAGNVWAVILALAHYCGRHSEVTVCLLFTHDRSYGLRPLARALPSMSVVVWWGDRLLLRTGAWMRAFTGPRFPSDILFSWEHAT